MNKARISGIIILSIGFFLMYKLEAIGNFGWLVNSLIGVVIGLGFILTALGRFNIRSKI
ncbi:MAG: hypothetical protein NWQ31_05190 [Polaribacter sp.]|nr:hypothetical protein [Polaribacter sp.]